MLLRNMECISQDTGKATVARDPKYSGFNKVVQVCVRGSDSFHLFCCAIPRVLPLPMWSNVAHLYVFLMTGRGKKKTGRHASVPLRTRLCPCVAHLFTCLRPVIQPLLPWVLPKILFAVLFMHSYLMYLDLMVYVFLELFKKQNLS